MHLELLIQLECYKASFKKWTNINVYFVAQKKKKKTYVFILYI